MRENPAPQKSNFKIYSFCDKDENHSLYVREKLIDVVDYFVANGLFVSRSELIRAAIWEFVQKKFEEEEVFQEFIKTKEFNNSQKKEVIIEGKKYKIVKVLD